MDVWVLLGIVAFAYVRSVRSERARRKVADDQPPVLTRGQMACFAGAVITLAVASDWPIHDVAEGYLYSVHMVQHLLMTLVAAMLLVAGTPAWMARRMLGSGRRLKVVRSLTGMVPALLIYNLVLVLSHFPVVVDATVRIHPLHFVAHAVLLASGIVLWLPILSPLPEVPRLRPPVQMLYLFIQTIIPTVPASFLTFATTSLYPIYATFPRLWGISAVTDQQTAGLIMKLVGGLWFWGVIVIVFFRWFASEERAENGPLSNPGGGRAEHRGPAPREDVLYWDDVEKELNRTR